MKLIELTKGQSTIVDDEDYERFARISWLAIKLHGNYYAARIEIVKGKKKAVFLHREIINTANGLLTDHKSGDTLDNRKENLREATRSQNACNAKKRIDGVTSKYKGVSFHQKMKKYCARICINKKPIHIGYFQSESEAGRAYNEAAIRYHGKFARINSIP